MGVVRCSICPAFPSLHLEVQGNGSLAVLGGGEADCSDARVCSSVPPHCWLFVMHPHTRTHTHAVPVFTVHRLEKREAARELHKGNPRLLAAQTACAATQTSLPSSKFHHKAASQSQLPESRLASVTTHKELQWRDPSTISKRLRGFPHPSILGSKREREREIKKGKKNNKAKKARISCQDPFTPALHCIKNIICTNTKGEAENEQPSDACGDMDLSPQGDARITIKRKEIKAQFHCTTKQPTTAGVVSSGGDNKHTCSLGGSLLHAWGWEWRRVHGC